MTPSSCCVVTFSFESICFADCSPKEVDDLTNVEDLGRIAVEEDDDESNEPDEEAMLVSRDLMEREFSRSFSLLVGTSPELEDFNVFSVSS